MLQLLNVTDPRDNLERAHRPELLKHAKENGVTEIVETMPAILMRKILRSRGLVKINVPKRTLGQYDGGRAYGGDAISETGAAASVSIDDDMERQWKQHESTQPQNMTMQAMRKECKRRGIKMVRTDNAETLKAKLNVENPA